jgi:hypothetical protein
LNVGAFIYQLIEYFHEGSDVNSFNGGIQGRRKLVGQLNVFSKSSCMAATFSC